MIKLEHTVPKTTPSNDFVKITTPDGKEYKLPVRYGTLGPPMIDIATLYQ